MTAISSLVFSFGDPEQAFQFAVRQFKIALDAGFACVTEA